MKDQSLVFKAPFLLQLTPLQNFDVVIFFLHPKIGTQDIVSLFCANL